MGSQIPREAINKIMDAKDKQLIFGNLASPPLNTTQRLTYSCMVYLRQFYDTHEQFNHEELCSQEMGNKIRFLRYDYTTLESILKVVDIHFKKKCIGILRDRLSVELSDTEILEYTLEKDPFAIGYIRKTINIDVILALLEGKALFKEGVSVQEFSKRIVEIFYEVYPIRKKGEKGILK